MTILSIEGLTKDFGGLRALHKVDLVLQEGEICGLIGPNGSGKTTMLNVMTGFLTPTEGRIIFDGESISGLEPHQIAEKGMIRTFQFTSLFPDLTVEDNIISARHLGNNGGFLGSIFWSRGYRRGEVKLRQEVMEILSFVMLEERAKMIARNLPAVEQRTLEIGIALAAKPKLLLLDEPASGMNLQEARRTMELIRAINQMGTTVLLVEHNMKVVMELCSKIFVLNQGVKIAEGSGEEITKDERVVSVYLGKKRERDA
jgi:branched-chain amino acid transport system ATP-binding protein